MITKYKVNLQWKPWIEKVDVQRETDLSVWIRGRRESKNTNYYAFLDTFDEAKNRIIEEFGKKILQEQKSIERSIEQIKTLKTHIENVKNMNDA